MPCNFEGARHEASRGGSGNGADMIGWAVRTVALWGGIALALYLAVGHRSAWLPSIPAPHETAVQSAVQQQRVPTNTLVYRANAQGHVLLEAVINGAGVPFVLDTGATMVALTVRDAAAAGINRYDLEFSRRVSTANGETRAAPVQLREIRLGQLSVEDVPAVVVENLQVSLLGQSFLRRLQSYEMRDGVLTITW